MFCLVVAALPAFWMPAGSSARDLDGGCFRGKPGFGMLMHGLNRLDLSTEQKHDIALILKEKRNEARTLVDQMVEARKKLFTTIGSTDYNESAVRQAAQEVARCHEELIVLRTQAGQQIKEVLTSEQKAKMEAAREHFGQRMQEHIDDHFDHLDQWIEENSR
ncbi:MAG: Spy/CpxP family protein refolding chaperone [Syntrophobacteraceae bacterium]